MLISLSIGNAGLPIATNLTSNALLYDSFSTIIQKVRCSRRSRFVGIEEKPFQVESSISHVKRESSMHRDDRETRLCRGAAAKSESFYPLIFFLAMPQLDGANCVFFSRNCHDDFYRRSDIDRIILSFFFFIVEAVPA